MHSPLLIMVWVRLGLALVAVSALVVGILFGDLVGQALVVVGFVTAVFLLGSSFLFRSIFEVDVSRRESAEVTEEQVAAKLRRIMFGRRVSLGGIAVFCAGLAVLNTGFYQQCVLAASISALIAFAALEILTPRSRAGRSGA